LNSGILAGFQPLVDEVDHEGFAAGAKPAETLNIAIGSVQSHSLSAGVRLIRTRKEHLFFGAAPVCRLKLVRKYSAFFVDPMRPVRVSDDDTFHND
jgi:hypothetical protein